MGLGFYFDQSRCMGCDACVAGCRSWNRLEPEDPDIINMVITERGEFPIVSLAHLWFSCYHCAEPRCTMVCPAQAITKNENGTVIADGEKCRVAGRCGIIEMESLPNPVTFDKVESPCQLTCPVHLDIPGYVALIAKGKFKEALDLIREKMPLPSVCGRVCMAPCEGQCSRQKVDQSVAIRALKRFVTDYMKDEAPPDRIERTQKDKVAIIGSGPAGLAAAYDLIRKGYAVTVFEATSELGGWLARGIPKYRLPSTILQRDIAYIAALGVEFKTNIRLGVNISLASLQKEGYGAVLLAMGAQRGVGLKLTAAELAGTMIATHFLEDANSGKPVKIGQKVAVIGGGNVAVDAARTVLRLGAKEAYLACLETREEMPAAAGELAEAEEEGVIICPGLSVTRILGENGVVTGVEFLKLRSVKFDADGRPQIDALPGTEHIKKADNVIFAVGQIPDVAGALGDSVQLTSRGTVAIDRDTMWTGLSGVFAAGDVVRGLTNVIEAIADGQKAALHIDYYLKSIPESVSTPEAVKVTDIKVNLPEGISRQDRQPLVMLTPATRKTTFEETTFGYNAGQAVSEAKRCLNCAGHLCLDVCPYKAPHFSAGKRVHIIKCNFCPDLTDDGSLPACVVHCPVQALDAGPMEALMAKHGQRKNLEGITDSIITQPQVIFRDKD